MKYRSVRSALTSKGFRKKDGRNHEKYYYHDLSGNKTEIFTLLSRATGNKELRNSLESDMARQLKIRKEQFRQFVSCDIEQVEYERIVRESSD